MRFADDKALVDAFRAFETLMLMEEPVPGELYRAQDDLRREVVRVAAVHGSASIEDVLYGVAGAVGRGEA